MTDIPDEIVERVARAIADVAPEREGKAFLPWSLYRQEQKAKAYDAARAALKECGWAEMREALEKSAEYILRDQNGQPRTPGYVLGEIAVALFAVRKP